MPIAQSLLQKIISNNRGFESANGFTSNSDTKPHQTLLYETSVNGTRCRLESPLTVDAQKRYSIGFGELFNLEASPQRLSVRVLDFNR